MLKDNKKLKEMKSKLSEQTQSEKVNEVLDKSDETEVKEASYTVTKSEIEKIFGEEFHELERRLYLGLRKDLYRIKDDVIKQLKYIQKRVSELENRVFEMNKAVDNGSGNSEPVDPEELKKQKEIEEHLAKLKELGFEVN